MGFVSIKVLGVSNFKDLAVVDSSRGGEILVFYLAMPLSKLIKLK